MLNQPNVIDEKTYYVCYYAKPEPVIRRAQRPDENLARWGHPA